jgi:serine/threonine protein kinase
MPTNRYEFTMVILCVIYLCICPFVAALVGESIKEYIWVDPKASASRHFNAQESKDWNEYQEKMYSKFEDIYRLTDYYSQRYSENVFEDIKGSYRQYADSFLDSLKMIMSLDPLEPDKRRWQTPQADQIEIYKDSIIGRGVSSVVYEGKFLGSESTRSVAVKLFEESQLLELIKELRSISCLYYLDRANAERFIIPIFSLIFPEGDKSHIPWKTKNSPKDAGKLYLRSYFPLVVSPRRTMTLRKIALAPRPYFSSMRVPRDFIRAIMKELLKAVGFIHRHDVLHLDLKPDNILLDCTQIQIDSARASGTRPKYALAIKSVQLIDFGLSRCASRPDRYMGPVITAHYRPPEVVFKLDYGFPAEIYSLGWILVDLLNPTLFRSIVDDIIKFALVRSIRFEEDVVWCLERFLYIHGRDTEWIARWGEYFGPLALKSRRKAASVHPEPDPRPNAPANYRRLAHVIQDLSDNPPSWYIDLNPLSEIFKGPLYDLIMSMLADNPKDRATPSELLLNHWISTPSASTSRRLDP